MSAAPTASNPTARDAIFYVPDGAFDRGLADVPVHLFANEQRQALDPNCPTGLVTLSLSHVLGLDWPASTPAMLARYVVVRAGERLQHEFQATGEIYCVLRGAGLTTSGDHRMAWTAGDVFVLPGASRSTHRADTDSLLVCLTNEPELAYARVRAPDAKNNGAVAAAFFSGRTIDEKLGMIYERTGPQKTAGKSVIFATTPLAGMRTILPSLTAAMNTLEPGGDQRPHLHNPAALTVALESESIHSMVAGQRMDWIPFGVMVTPPRAEHSHHNRGPRMMKSFVVQDGALYYQLRNPGFAWTGA